MLRFALLIFLPAWVTAQEPVKLTRRQSGDLAIQARQILKKYCSDCHGEKLDRSQLSVITHSQLISKTPPVPFVSRETTRHQMLEYIEDGSMPPGGRDRPNDKEVEILKQWATAKSPSFPKAFDDATTLDVMLTDWANVDALDQRFMRYISLAHLVSETEAPALGTHERKLSQMFLKLLGESVKPPDPVDDTATLFRLDLRTMGWETRDLFEKWEDASAAGVVKFTPFDLLLTDYPHSPNVPRERLETFLNTTEQIRPVPYIRGDWLVNALVTPTNGLRPLGEDIQSVMDHAKEKKKPKPKSTAGPKFREDQAYFNAKDYTGSTMPPVGAWYLGDVGPEKPPFKLKFEAVDTKREAITSVSTKDIFQLDLTCDRDINFHIYMVISDGEIRIQEINRDPTLKANSKTLIKPKSNTPFKISSIINGFENGTYEYFILLASEQKTKPPVIIRSKHDERPIYRIIPQDGEPSTIQRVVLPIRVTN